MSVSIHQTSELFHRRDETSLDRWPVEAIQAHNRHLDQIKDAKAAEAKIVAKLQEVFSYMLNSCANVISAVNFSNPMSIFFSILTDMVQYLKYIDIDYPTKLQLTFNSADVLAISIVPNIPDKLARNFPSSPLPASFQKYDFPSSFFVNFWYPSVNLASLLIGLMIVCIFEKCMKSRKGRIYSFFAKLKKVLKWNYSLSLLLSYYGHIILFSSFEFRTNNLTGTGPILSFTLCVLMNALSLFVLLYMIRIIIKIRSAKAEQNRATGSISQSHHLTVEKTKWEDWQMVFDSFKEDSFFHQAYLPITTLRIVLFYIIIAYLYSWPLLQITLITLLSLSMIFYLVTVRSPKEFVQLIECLVQEAVILVINALVLGLAILNKVDSSAHASKETIGDIIIWTNTGFCMGGSIYMLLKTVIIIFYRLKESLKKCLKRGKVSPMIPDTGVPATNKDKISPSDLNDISVMIPISLNGNETCDVSGLKSQTKADTSLLSSELPIVEKKPEIDFIGKKDEDQCNIDESPQKGRTRKRKGKKNVIQRDPNRNLTIRKPEDENSFSAALKDQSGCVL